MKQLSILIPTYNRKDRLIDLLKNIALQGHWGEYDLIISDNNSNYNVMSIVNDNFENDFIKGIRFYSNGFNTGLGTNISFPFTYVKTNWCMLMSDDDEIKEGFLDRLFLDINVEENNDVIAIKYSTIGLDVHEKDVCFSSVDEYSEYYLNRSRGDRWYLAMLFNIRLLHQYCCYFTQYSYSCLSFHIPIILSLIDKKGRLRISSYPMFVYARADGDSWYSKPESYLKTLVGARTLFDIYWPIKKRSAKNLKKMLSEGHFNSRRIVVLIFKLHDFEKRKHYYSLLRDYMIDPWYKKLTYKLIFYITCYLRMSPELFGKR